MKKNKVVKYKKPFVINIGVVIFSVILVYLIICVFQYLTSTKISPYEVQVGNIAQNDSYTAFAIRNEKIIYASDDGYINYFAKDNTKVGAKSLVYSLDQSGNLFQTGSDEDENTLSDSDYQNLDESLRSFCNSYSNQKFYDVYGFKNNLKSSIMECQTMNDDGVIDTSKLNISNVSDLTLFYAQKPGVVLYSIDGYEDTTINNFTADLLNESSYVQTNLKLNHKISANDPVYKLVTGEKWKLILSVSNEIAEDLADEDYLNIKFKEDESTAWASCSIKDMNGHHYLILNFNNSMIRYAKERYVDIEFSVTAQEGLKIPNSSILKKNFWVIPTTYLTKGGNSSSTGVILLSDTGKSTFVAVSVFQQTDDYAYISCDALKKDNKILEPTTNTQYTLNKEKTIQGVYNINKGYAVFRQISVLTSNEDYSIVGTGTDYGIGVYDHIALDATTVKEGDVINE